jgi:hypothetical protein
VGGRGFPAQLQAVFHACSALNDAVGTCGVG